MGMPARHGAMRVEEIAPYNNSPFTQQDRRQRATMDHSDASLTPQYLPETINTPQIYVIIRFSASIPDLRLSITSPSTTTAAGLKQLIRAHLPPNLSNRRIRLIYSGRGLEDAVPLSTSLKLPLPPPSSRTSTPSSTVENGLLSKEKGKAAVRDVIPANIASVYVHCSIGDIVLSASDLDAEKVMALTILLSQQKQKGSVIASAMTNNGQRGDDEERKGKEVEEGDGEEEQNPLESMTTPAPRGFDRLLSAGFTPGEVAALRSQFMALQAVSHTPDTMPTGAELRELEDRWMDEGSSADGAGTGLTFAGGDDVGGFGSSSQRALDDMLWGAVIGFFWPIGCAMWLRREEGVWSWQRDLAVFVGVMVNVVFGAVRVMI